jgi:hypothetical protein
VQDVTAKDQNVLPTSTLAGSASFRSLPGGIAVQEVRSATKLRYRQNLQRGLIREFPVSFSMYSGVPDLPGPAPRTSAM